MRFFHLSDLHLGKRLGEASLIEDQEYILAEIINIVERETPDCLLIAGDVYDKSVPSAEAVRLFDSFLSQLKEKNIKVFVISGNHDSAERIAFGSRLMSSSGIYMSPVYSGNLSPITLKDEYGEINIYMLPFIKPANVRSFFEEENIESYTDAVKTAINSAKIDKDKRNILVAHQFVTGASRCESEDISVGGSDNVDSSVFEDFDYVALGHIHSPQNVGSEKMRYCGTPLKYSFSEAGHNKSITVLDFKEKGNITLSTIPLTPKRDLREIKGSYMELTARDYYFKTNVDDYLHITLTDEEDIPDAINKLRVIYKNILKLGYDNKRTRENKAIDKVNSIENKSPLELFSEFYELQNNQSLSKEQTSFVSGLIEKIWEDN